MLREREKEAVQHPTSKERTFRDKFLPRGIYLNKRLSNTVNEMTDEL